MIDEIEYEISPNEAKKRKQKEIIKREKEREREDFRKLLSTPEGRRFCWKIMSDAGLYRSSFTGNSETFFNEGKRQIGLMVQDEIEAIDEMILVTIKREARKRHHEMAQQMEQLR